MRAELEQAIGKLISTEFSEPRYHEPLWEKVAKFPVILVLYSGDSKTLYVNNKVKHVFQFQIVYTDKRLTEKAAQAEQDALNAIEELTELLSWKTYTVKSESLDDTQILGRVRDDSMERRVFGASNMYYGIIVTLTYECEIIVPIDVKI